MPASSKARSPSPDSLPLVPHRHRYDADYADSALDSSAVAGIAAAHERSRSLVDEAPDAAGASEERHAAYEAQAMR